MGYLELKNIYYSKKIEKLSLQGTALDDTTE